MNKTEAIAIVSDRNRNIALVCLVIVCLMSFSSCDSDKSEGRKHRRSAHLIETFTTLLKPVVYSTTRTGTLIPRRKLNIHNQEEGLLKKLPYFEGDKVKKGDLLVKIDDALLSAQLRKANANSQQAKQNLGRIRRLHKQRLISEDQMVKSQTDYKVALAEEQQLQTRLNNTSILAPFDGVVTLRNKEQGDVVPKFTLIMSIVDPQSLVTQVKISELLIPSYKLGDKVDVLIDALGSQNFTGIINRIHPTIDGDTRQGTLEVKLSPIPQGAKGGQLCRVTLNSSPKLSISIPAIALRQDKKGEFVYVVEKGKKDLIVKRMGVRSGLRHGDMVTIPFGLDANVKIVSKGFLGIRPGKKVVDAKAKRRPHGKPGQRNQNKKDGENKHKHKVVKQ